jgi:hypothetical protein
MYPKHTPKYAWLGSLINEPNRESGEKVNCRIVEYDWSIPIPEYPHINMDTIVLVELISPVRKGEELLLDY